MESFLSVVEAKVLGLGVGPGEGEGVRGPEADGGYDEEAVLTWFESPGAREAESDAHGVTGENLDLGACATAADIAVDDEAEADETFDDPDGDDGLEVSHLVEALQMDPQSGQD